MSLERPSAYERLTLEAAARVDAACDGFEKAWKAARSGAETPLLSKFLDSFEGHERTVLAGELVALDQACRKRYGFPTQPENPLEVDAGVRCASSSPTHLLRSRTAIALDGQADRPQVPGLELMEVLGSGGMGVVFRARQTTLGRDVAVKFLRDAHTADWEQRERFLQEARAVARLRHPNLVQLYEFGETPVPGGGKSQPYLVLEYVPGGSLADLMRGSPQRPKEAAGLVETLAHAIHYAHQQGVIHRDLKPANILLSDERRGMNDESSNLTQVLHSSLNTPHSSLVPKITDFGLAKFLAGSDLTQTGDVLGTPGYMAPEQAAGKFGSITAAVDVYGLGAILYESLTGRPPFQAETAPATVYQVQHDDPVTPRRLQPTIPRDLETICLKCLRKEPGRRYATAQELADDLHRFQAGEPIRARPVGTVERMVVWCRRRPAVAGLVAALALVFLIGSSGVLWQWQRASRNAAQADRNAAAYRRERDIARQEKERAEHHLKIVRDHVKQLDRLGHELLQTPGKYRAGQAVLQQALAFYQELLPEEGNDPEVRREAADLFGQVAWIHHILGQEDKAAGAWDHQAELTTSLLQEDPADTTLRMGLADCHRWRGNALRFQAKATEALKAYGQAADLHEDLLRDFPDEAGYHVALANTLLNMAPLLSGQTTADEQEQLYQRILNLYRTAVRAAPDNPKFKAELGLALEGEGQFFLNTGRTSQAEAPVREALEIHQKMRTAGLMKGSIERAEARSFACLGRVFAAAARPQEAEESYRQAVNLLDRPFNESPESASRRAELAHTLAGLADQIHEPGRREEAADILRRAISHYEKLRVDFPDNTSYRLYLVSNYLRLTRLLGDLGQSSEADKPYRKALELESEDAAVNNELAWFLATSSNPRWRDPARAVRLAKKAVAVQQDSANCRNTLGVAHYCNGDYKDAVTELKRAMDLRSAGDSFDWFFLAMAHWRLGESDLARTWFDRAVQWMDKYNPQDDELRRIRAEAEALLSKAGIRKNDDPH
jgi:serine/threonine protein kinase/Tfp pilus assembly protein PilF